MNTKRVGALILALTKGVLLAKVAWLREALVLWRFEAKPLQKLSLSFFSYFLHATKPRLFYS